jgi:hypothetical protein
MIFGLPAVVGAGLIGTAAFGIAKLAGASTKTALLAGLGTFGGMAALNAMNPTIFGQTVAKESMGAALGGSLPQTKTATDLGFMVGGGGLGGQAAPTVTSLAKAGGAGLMSTTPQALGTSLATVPEAATLTGAGGMEAGGALKQAFTADAARLATPALAPTPASPGLLNQASDFIGNMSTAEKIGLGVGGATLLSGLNQPEQLPLPQQMPYSEQDYAAAKARQDEAIEGMAGRADYSFERPRTQSVYEPINPIYANEGGLISLAHFSEGGVHYLPSKTDHDEQDSNNYVRATGYVEDGSGNGDKDEDTMLAQLADGEFVSRADAILGAGIMSGASPADFKDMRRKGAQFFYKQQDQLKRIYDIVNATDQKS